MQTQVEPVEVAIELFKKAKAEYTKLLTDVTAEIAAKKHKAEKAYKKLPWYKKLLKESPTTDFLFCYDEANSQYYYKNMICFCNKQLKALSVLHSLSIVQLEQKDLNVLSVITKGQ